MFLSMQYPIKIGDKLVAKPISYNLREFIVTGYNDDNIFFDPDASTTKWKNKSRFSVLPIYYYDEYSRTPAIERKMSKILDEL